MRGYVRTRGVAVLEVVVLDLHGVVVAVVRVRDRLSAPPFWRPPLASSGELSVELTSRFTAHFT